MLKHKHPEFQSDIYTMLETVGAQLEIGNFLIFIPMNTFSETVYTIHILLVQCLILKRDNFSEHCQNLLLHAYFHKVVLF